MKRPPLPASDRLCNNSTGDHFASFGPRHISPCGDVSTPETAADVNAWSVYEWVSDAWEWRADCNSRNTAETLANALTAGA